MNTWTADLSLPSPGDFTPTSIAMPRPRSRHVAGMAVLAAHIGLAWAITHWVRQPAHAPEPVLVALQLLSPETPAPAQAPQPPQPRQQTLPPPPQPAAPVPPADLPPPEVAVAAPAAPAPAPAVVSSTAPAALPVVMAAPAPAPTPATPTLVPASALRYVVPPRQVYPSMSRKLGEAGTVLVRVIVDVHGYPRSVTLQQSSGFPRLDEQALQAMRAARFQPYTEHGNPVEAQAIAPLAYTLE